ncbi:MAG: FAD-dependent oxidoreductase, partial [Comamonas sp.]
AVHWLDAAQLAESEPGLNPDARPVAALRLPSDEVGNCRQLLMTMRAEAARIGVQFRFNAQVMRLEALGTNGSWRLHLASGASVDTSWLVLCASEGAAALLKPLGCRLPLQAAHGYTLTAQVREPLHAPRHAAVTDLGRQVTITRQGQRIRVSGGYRLGPQPHMHDAAAVRTLYQTLGQWFPGAAVLDGSTQTWAATVWMTADDHPIIGPAPQLPGIWLNVGHGFNGWGHSLQAAEIVASRFAT